MSTRLPIGDPRSFPALVAALACLAGCGNPSGPLDIRDVRQLRQDPSAYVQVGELDRPLIEPGGQQELFRRFRQAWLAPWDPAAPGPSSGDIHGPFAAFDAELGYGENLRPHTKEFAHALMDNATGRAVDARAIAVANTNLRRLPTERPRFEEVSKAGEGFPFDTFQESALWAGTPLRLWRVTRDGRWGLVDSPAGRGWTPMRDLATVDEQTARLYHERLLVSLMRDHVTVGDSQGAAAVVTHIGAVFPLLSDRGRDLEVLLPVRDAEGRCLRRAAVLSKDEASVMPAPATPRTVATLAGGMVGQPYCWGGMLEGRDCSATVRDILIPLGIPLPRNSADQAAAWASIPLKHLPPQQRERVILEQGRPFLSLVRFPGHIALYLGQHEGRAIILHNAWGIRTRRGGVQGRKIVGRCVITTLQPGMELPDIDLPRGDLRNSIESLVLVGQAKPAGP